VTRKSCTWRRFTTLYCYQQGGDTYYQLLTNSLPNHCYYAPTNPPLGSSDSYNAYLFQGKFNARISEMTGYTADAPYYFSQYET
jgi:hypothetical protein